MKKIVNILYIMFLAIIVSGCFEKAEVQIEVYAFNSLTDEERALIPASPGDSIVDKVIVTDEITSIIGKEYEGKEVYLVTFNHTETADSGNIIVYMDLDKKTVLRKGYANKG